MDRWISRAAARLRSLRRRAASEEGFSIVEVVVSAAMVAFIAGGVLTGLDAAGGSAADLRHRSQADEVANQDQERMRGMSSAQLNNLNQTRTVSLDGTDFTVTSTGQFLNSQSGGSSCSSTGTADFVKIVSSVTWATNRRPPVIEQSIITPPIGGTLQARAVDQSNAGLAGVNVDVDGPERLSAITDASGCTTFAGVGLGDYTFTASKAGYVDPNGNTSVTGQATATAADTATVNFTALGQAGAINASFQTRVNGTFYGAQRAPAMSMFVGSSPVGGMSGPKTVPASDLTLGSPTIDTRTAPAVPLFPFTTDYSVWAGGCLTDQPPTANRTFARVNPGATAIPTVTMPALKVFVTYRSTLNPAGSLVAPSTIALKDGCGQNWRPQVRPVTPTSPSDPLGQLNFPGQPYAANAIGQRLTICADYDPPGITPPYKTNPNPTTANTDFTNGTSVNLTIDSRSSANRGSCPAAL